MKVCASKDGQSAAHWPIVYALSALYFLLIGRVNVEGADDFNMLSIFRIDELPIYDAVTSMVHGLTGGEGIRLGQFLNPKQHVYGYLYHFLNSLALLLLRPVNAALGLNAATFDILVLRQLSVLYFLVALCVLLRTFLGQARPFAVILAWASLAILPATVFNNTWMHPDNLVLLLVACTCAALVKDAGEFRRWFWVASVFWGLATNTKLIGVFLFPVFAYYCFSGTALAGARPLVKLSKLLAAGCVAGLVYFATSPQLYFGSNFRNFISAMLDYSQTYVLGTRNVASEPNPLLWYRTVIGPGYFHWVFIFTLAVGWFLYARRSSRTAWILSLATLPLLLNFLLNVGWTGYWYLIPTLVPAMVPAFFVPPALSLSRTHRILSYLAVMVALVQIAMNASATDVFLRAEIAKEANSGAIALYRMVREELGDKMQDVKAAFRDPYIYIPAQADLKVRMKWGLATYADIEVHPTDLVILQRDYIERCSDDAKLRQYMEYMKQSYEMNLPCRAFYSDAKEGRLRGFRLLVENDFGMAFVRSDL